MFAIRKAAKKGSCGINLSDKVWQVYFYDNTNLK